VGDVINLVPIRWAHVTHAFGYFRDANSHRNWTLFAIHSSIQSKACILPLLRVCSELDLPILDFPVF
jgi:hypothetical protein